MSHFEILVNCDSLMGINFRPREAQAISCPKMADLRVQNLAYACPRIADLRQFGWQVCPQIADLRVRLSGNFLKCHTCH